jgi:hypothetical protein
MDSQPVSISINLKIKGQEITLSMEEARDLYSQLKGVLGYNNQPFVLPYPWGTATPYINYTLNCSDNTNSNWKLP